MKKKYLLNLALSLAITGYAGICQATAISYTATDLTDVVSGEDLWEYSYSVSENTFDTDYGFTIYFDLGLYDFLDPAPAAPNVDWDVISWDPDPFLPDGGGYDALARTDNASLADLFTISFVWLGGAGGPGAQAFDVYDPSWQTIESGSTTSAAAPVPEPATMLLFATGLAGLAGYRKKFKQQ